MRVYVYWNLNRNCYSVRAEQGPKKGRVIAHCREIELHNVTFAVGAIGRLKSIVGPKRVHAGMRGDLVSYKPDASVTKTMRAITYNPLKHACFITRDNCLPTYSASHVIGLSTADNRANVFAAASTPAEIDHVKMAVEEYIAQGDFPADDDSPYSRGEDSIKLGK